MLDVLKKVLEERTAKHMSRSFGFKSAGSCESPIKIEPSKEFKHTLKP